MLLALVVASLTAAASAPACTAEPLPPAAISADSTLEALYALGEPFDAFLASAKARRATWVKHWEDGAVPADALATARAIPGQWRLLVTAIDSCSDSVNTIPYLARLVALLPNVDLRIINPTLGKGIMEAHRTPDGRPATPTVVVLNAAGDEAGCWIERPSELQKGFVAAKAAGKSEEDAFVRNKQSWYDADAGASTVRELVAVLQAAAAGKPLCDANLGSSR